MRTLTHTLLTVLAPLTIMAMGALALPAVAKPVRKPPAPVDTALTGMWMMQAQAGAPMDLNDAGLKVQEAQRMGVDPAPPGSPAPMICKPLGVPAMMANDYAIEFLETPGRLTVINEGSSLVRTVYLDEAVHTKGLDPSFNGHSIGHWETRGKARALVIDTVGFNDKAGVLGPFGVHSSTTHMTERFHLENRGQTLVGEFTFEDPRFLNKAWIGQVRYKRLPPGSELWEYPCEAGVIVGPSRLTGDPGGRRN